MIYRASRVRVRQKVNALVAPLKQCPVALVYTWKGHPTSIMANASVKMVILDGMHCIPVFHATPGVCKCFLWDQQSSNLVGAVQRATGVLAGTASRAPTLALEQ